MTRDNTIYGQLMESIKKKIISGELKIGERLESERTMSEKYGINRMTVRKALKYLEEEGILESKLGSGTYVRKMPVIEGKLSMDDDSLSLSLHIRHKGMKPSRQLLSLARVIPEGNVRTAYPDEEAVYEITRMAMINDKPYALQKAYIPCSLFSDAERFDFEEGSLYEYMQDKGYKPRKIVTCMRIERIPSGYAEIMQTEEDKKFMLFEYYGYDEKERMLEYTISYQHPDYTKFSYESEIKRGAYSNHGLSDMDD